jgi:hypothetical protein
LNFKFPLKKIIFVFMIFSVGSLITPLSSSYASLDLDSEINLSSSNVSSTEVKITEDGNIYVIWKEGADIFFKRSTDNGNSFEGSQNLSNTSGVASKNPQISASGSNVSVVWDEGAEIKIKSSTDSGSSFGSVTNLSNSPATSTNAKVEVSNSNIFVIWKEGTDVLFKRSIDNGSTFEASKNLGSAQPPLFETPQITSDISDVFVVWADESLNGFTSADIFLSSSTSSGASFENEINLSSTGNDSLKTQIAVSGTNVHVVWVENGEIKIKSSTDNGVSFGSTKNLSDNTNSSGDPQISASGADVHVVWKDGTENDAEILYTKSTDNGSTWQNIINLSENDDLSETPQVYSSGTNVFVVWKDDSFGSDTDSNILLRSSTDRGSNFSSFQIINDSTDIFTAPHLVSSGTDVYIVWNLSAPFPETGDVFFRTGVVSSNVLNFDSSQYTIDDSPTITVIDTSAINSTPDETKSAIITSDSDATGISITLIENADTGVFTNSFTLTSGSSSTPSKTLHAKSNDVITAAVEGVTGSASIFPIGISFDFSTYDYGDIAHLTVIDESSNLDTNNIDTVSVDIISDVDSTGLIMPLLETGPNTGIFGCDNSNLIFMTNNQVVSIYDTITISSTDNSSNTNSSKKDSIIANVTSTSDTIGISLTLLETEIDSGIFEGVLSFSDSLSDSNSGTLKVKEGDFFSVSDPTAEFISNGMILPNPYLSNGAIIVGGIPGGGNVTASYQSFTDKATVFDLGAGGGGGGGLVRPSLVVNALAGIGGGGSAYSSPTIQLSNLVKLGQLDVPSEVEQMIYDHDSTIPVSAMDLGLFENFDYPLIINDKGFVLSGFSTTLETQTLETNTPHTIKLMYYETDKIQHFSLYTNLRDVNTAIHQSDTQIQYNDGEEIEVIDPNGFFKDVSFTLNELDDLKKEIVLELTFANEMDTTDIILRSWDPFLNSFDTYILDAITVVSDEITESPITTYEEPIIEELQSQTIPIWIKNNAAWWSEQQIGDSDFV